MKKFTVVGLGEVLWDLLPSGKQVGGAPANFAYMSSLLGDTGIVASRVGPDALGTALAAKLRELGLQVKYLQHDPGHHTGIVEVDSDENSQPRYRIAENVSWDFLEWTPAWRELAEQADAVCFGSLAQRTTNSRETIYHFLRTMHKDAVRIFDVNLRQQFYSADIFITSSELAHIVKMNHEELPVVMKLLGGPVSDALVAGNWLRQQFALKVVCVTHGDHGSILLTEGGVDVHHGFALKPVDTVGAGDAFTAGLVHHYLRGTSLATMNEAANRMGAWVASQRGATPPGNDSVLTLAKSGAHD
jgi:fructokinase